jgi:hypothetical protein
MLSQLKMVFDPVRQRCVFLKTMIACIHDRSRRSLKSGLVLFAIISAGLTGCSSTEQLSVKQTYKNKRFSGKDLSGQTIILTPLISGKGAETGDQFEPSVLIGEIRKTRPDLRLRRPAAFLKRYESRYGSNALDSLYRNFFNGAIVALQTDGRIWKEVGSGYLMVLKLTFGLKTKSLDDRTLRQMRLEGELWDCDSSEVVWRSVVDSRSTSIMETDKDILLKAVVELFSAMPPVLDGYGKGLW